MNYYHKKESQLVTHSTPKSGCATKGWTTQRLVGTTFLSFDVAASMLFLRRLCCTLCHDPSLLSLGFISISPPTMSSGTLVFSFCSFSLSVSCSLSSYCFLSIVFFLLFSLFSLMCSIVFALSLALGFSLSLLFIAFFRVLSCIFSLSLYLSCALFCSLFSLSLSL